MSSDRPAPLLYESHCHTPLCKHATGLPSEYVRVALSRGLRGIIFTDHCPLPGGVSAGLRMAPEQFEDYVALIDRVRLEFAGRIDVRLGLESDYYPGVEGWIKELHQRAHLHYVLGSVHPHIADYRTAYFQGDCLAYQQTYFDHLAMSAESGLYDCLAHPDLIKNERPTEWQYARIEPAIERALDRIAKTGVAMELNTSGVNKSLPEMNPGLAMLQAMHARAIPVVLGADAHRPERVADGYETALRTLRSVGYQEVSYFLDRKRHAVPIDAAIASLAG
ncbi:MAG TPA: histidinol-phosphatase [Opitutaceae bacterium]|nr:histidinol-phosphatase [Opitutaceae bacterium]